MRITKKALLEFIQQAQSNLIDYIEDLGKKMKQKKIRLLRVSLKQHKTFTAFINFAKQNNTLGSVDNKKNASIESFQPLSTAKTVKKLYKKSGKTRKWHVCQKKSALYLDMFTKKDLKPFQKYCKHQSKKHKKKFYKAYGIVCKHNTHKTVFTDIYNYFTKNTLISHKENYMAYKYHLIETVKQMMQKKPIDIDTIHDIRKEIKHLLYFGQIFNDKDTLTRKYFSKLIGRTNDKDDLIDALKTYQLDKKTKKKGRLWAESAVQNLQNQLQNDSKTIIHKLEEVFIG